MRFTNAQFASWYASDAFLNLTRTVNNGTGWSVCDRLSDKVMPSGDVFLPCPYPYTGSWAPGEPFENACATYGPSPPEVAATWKVASALHSLYFAILLPVFVSLSRHTSRV